MAFKAIDCSSISPFIKKIFFAGPRLEISPIEAENIIDFKVSENTVVAKSADCLYTSEDPTIIEHYTKLCDWYTYICNKLNAYPQGVVEAIAARFIPLLYNGFTFIEQIDVPEKKIEVEIFDHYIIAEQNLRKHFINKGFVTLRTERLSEATADEPLRQTVAIVYKGKIMLCGLIPLRTLPDAKTQELLFTGQ